MTKIALLDISVSPRSSRSTIKVDRSSVKVHLNSPPVDGKANEECIKLFSKKLKVPKSGIRIVKGEKGRKKRIEINGLSNDDVLRLLKG